MDDDCDAPDRVLSQERRTNLTDALPFTSRMLMFSGYIEAHLIKDDVLSSRQYQQIRCLSTNHDRALYFINEVLLRGPNRKYVAFIKVLRTIQLDYIADVIEKKSPTPKLRSQGNPDADQSLLGEAEKNTLNRNRAFLVSHITPSFMVIAYMQQKQIIDDVQCQKIQSHDTPESQVREILDIILKGPKWKYTAFLQALCDSRLEHVVRFYSSRPSQPDQDNSLLSEEEKDLLLDKLPVLMEVLQASTMFYAYLLQKGAISTEFRNFLEGKTNTCQVLHLVLYLLRSPRWHLEAFTYAITQSRQEHTWNYDPPKPIYGKLWDRKSEQLNRLLPEDKVSHLKSKISRLTDLIRVSDRYYGILLHYRVLDVPEYEEIRGASDKPDWMQVTDLVCFLFRRPLWTYHGFLKTLVCCRQDNILTQILDEAITNYTDR